jgi:midasin (ATPase involved in ribosome maturation)
MYKIKNYTQQIRQMDTETQKRFEMIQRLSRDFSIENKTALAMDELLFEQIQLENASVSTPEPKTITAKQQPSKPTPVVSKNKKDQSIEESFEELFHALKQVKNPSGFSSNQKVGFDNLDAELQRLLSSKPQTIRYEIRDVKTNEFAKPDIPSFQNIVDDVLMGNNVFLVGGAGTGKTYMAENLISKLALGRQSITINCSQWTSPTEIIGGQTMDGYVEGKLIEAWQKGYVLILDELPKIDPNTAGLFNDALAKTKIPNAVVFNSRKESFVKHPNFSCIATGNIYPDKESISYGANNKQDLSLLDRFSGSVYFIEKNPKIEKEILQNEMVWSICDAIRTVIEQLKYEAQLSLRFMLNARDSYNLEMQRVNESKKSGVNANEGKTFKSAVDSYLSTFTEIQQKNIKENIYYSEYITSYQYRSLNPNKKVY